MSRPPAVLFVCLGNICRSPMAEAAFRRAAEARGVEVEVASAGTGPWHVGDPPDPRAQATAAQHGIDISGYRGRRVEPADFHRFDRILALDRDNLADLRRLRPRDAKAELSLLLDHAPGRQGASVPDPYYGGEGGFERVWAEVTAAAEGLLDRIGKPR